MPFRYPVCVVLDRLAGQITAVNAINEVAALEFISIAEQADDKDSYISKTCKRHEVYVTGSYIPLFRERRLRYYLAQTYELIEVFFSEFKSEYEEFFGADSWKVQSKEERKKDGEEPQLLEILRNTPDGQKLKPHAYLATIEYYRIMRNCIVHATPEPKAKQKLHKNLDKLKHRLATLYEDETPKIYSFEAPNAIHNLQLDDIRLFSRCLQRFARMISDLAKPSEQALVDSVFNGTGGAAFLQSYKKKSASHKFDIKQRRKMIQFRLIDRFGLTTKEASEIVNNTVLPTV